MNYAEKYITQKLDKKIKRIKQELSAGKKEIKIEHNLLNTYKECIELYKKENEVNLKYTNKQMAYMIGEWLGFSEEQVNKDLQQK